VAVGLRQRLLAVIVGVALLTVAALYVLSRTTIRTLLVERLGHRALSVGRLVARESEGPILTGELFRLRLKAREYERSEKDLEYVFYLDRDGKVLAHSFPEGFPTELASANPLPPGVPHSTRTIRAKDNVLLDVAVPILDGELGSVHLGMSEEAIDRDVSDLLHRIYLTMGLVVLLGGGLSAALASRAMRPLLGLTRLAGRVAEGKYDERADIRSRDEIGDLARAFNGMIEARGAHERERERLLAELRDALDNVKTLSGFLPICSHCKKIRNDEGYWQQVETYVTQQTGALFSHGICPDCTRTVLREAEEESGRESGKNSA
jgi:HAMP domain-containing protein